MTPLAAYKRQTSRARRWILASSFVGGREKGFYIAYTLSTIRSHGYARRHNKPWRRLTGQHEPL